MSQKYFTHATPTLFNAGTPNQQLSSCYLLALEDDSITGIYNTHQIVRKFPNILVVLGYIFIIFAHRVAIFAEQMEKPMV